MSYSLEELAIITDDETFAVAAENPTGCRGGGKSDRMPWRRKIRQDAVAAESLTIQRRKALPTAA